MFGDSSPVGGDGREPLYVDISVCAICDKDRDPLSVPDKPCGHSRENARMVPVEVVPRSSVGVLVEALEALVAWFEENDDRASDFGELFVVKDARRALRSFYPTTGGES